MSLMNSQVFLARTSRRFVAAVSTGGAGGSFSNQRSRSAATSAPQDDQNTQEEFQHPQDFVQVQFEPGEWDMERKDPLYRPPFRSRARIISAEDFAARPRVGFSEEFDSMHDAMVTLSWMSAKQCDEVYALYLEMMSRMGVKGKATSHEYVMRVIGQKYNITSSRVAAIVQLAHNEEQYRKEGRPILTELQDYVDQKIANHIATAYGEYQEVQPREPFVEDPRGIIGQGEAGSTSSSANPVSDLIDVDGLIEETLQREAEEAKLIINNHIYEEDVDENRVNVKISKECKSMIKRKSQLTEDGQMDPSSKYTPMPGGEQPRRQRWKYVAKVVNTRENKKKSWRKQETTENILVEQDGALRMATVAEAKQTAWKPVRNTQEFTYGGVKQAWLDRTLRGAQGVWGRQEAPKVIEATKEENGGETKEGEGEGEDKAEREAEAEAEASEGDGQVSEGGPQDNTSEAEQDDDENGKKE